MNSNEILESVKRFPVIKDAKDERDFLFEETGSFNDKLPEQFDRIKELTPIKDQGKRGTCVAFASVALAEWHIKKKKKEELDLSEQFLFDVMKDIDTKEGYNSNTSRVRTGMKALGKYGVCLESLMKYEPTADPAEWKTQDPPPLSRLDAIRRRIVAYLSVQNNIEAIKKAVYYNSPVTGAFRIYPNFRDSKNTGVLPMPESNMVSDGGHAILIVGWNDNKKAFIAKNSWGTSWGDKGYLWIPYDLFPKHTYSFWCITD